MLLNVNSLGFNNFGLIFYHNSNYNLLLIIPLLSFNYSHNLSQGKSLFNQEGFMIINLRNNFDEVNWILSAATRVGA